MIAAVSDIPTYAAWTIFVLLGGALLAHALRVSREKHKAKLEEQKKKEADARDSAAIYAFLVESKKEGRFEFRKTTAIASHTKLPESRVEELCSKHPKIKRNEKELQSWHLMS